MSARVISLGPVIVVNSKLTSRQDELGNQVIDSVVRVFFPTLENLRKTLERIQQDPNLGQLKIFRASKGRELMTAKWAAFSIGSEAALQLALSTPSPASSVDSSSELQDDLCPTVVAVSEPVKEGDYFRINLSIALASMDNMDRTETLMHGQHLGTEVQTHLRSNRDNPSEVADFMLGNLDEMNSSTSSLLGGIVDDHFNEPGPKRKE